MKLTKEDYLKLSKERLAELLVQKDNESITAKVEPKFKIGDKVHLINGSSLNYEDDCIVISDISNNTYYGNWEGGYFAIKDQDKYELVEQKPAWSEEDEKIYNAILRDVRNGEPLDKLQYDWLKSLKDRVQPQPKQEWSEEDESCLITIINELEVSKSVSKYETKTYDKLLNWLKSLRPQKKQEWSKDDEILLEGIIGAVSNKKLLNKYQIEWLSNLSPQSHWKPSESDIRILEQVIDGTANPINYHATLHAILEKLKKLKEE